VGKVKVSGKKFFTIKNEIDKRKKFLPEPGGLDLDAGGCRLKFA
jgi:hypothetical protein